MKETGDKGSNKTPVSSVKQDQIHSLLFNREVGWQEIIYDLINTEQLDPWDVDIVVLTDKYLARIEKLEETDFFVSSKVLFAAALLLRIKSEILLKKYIRSIDEILFENKDTSRRIGLEPNQILSIELEEAIPELVPKSPLPRFKRVTLQELMESLNKAIITENRRIKKEIVKRNAVIESSLSLPKKTFSIKDKIKEIYDNLLKHLGDNGTEKRKKISFAEFIGENREERIISFSGLLHLDQQKKVWLEQENHFEDFYIWLKETYFSHNPDPFSDLKVAVEEQINEMDESKIERLDKIKKDFENPIKGI